MLIGKLLLATFPLALLAACAQSHRPEAVYYPAPTPTAGVPTSDRPVERVYPAPGAAVVVQPPNTPPPAVATRDVGISESISRLFQEDPSISGASDNVLASVYHGVVTLKGNVPSEHDRDEILLRVRKIPGVRYVDTDHLHVNIQ